MTTFGLVHGGWHGAWCWDLLAAELDRRGHRSVAVDLPTEDPNAGCARYAELTVRALAGVSDDLVLVGHSLGGLSVALVPAARLVRRLVFLAALLPDPGRSADDQARAGSRATQRGLGAEQIVHPDGSTSWPAAAAVRWFYPDCPAELARWAAARLRRQYWTPTSEVTPLVSWPDVEYRYLWCAEDRVIDAGWVRRVVPERLGVEPVELPGGHSPFLSRPAALADVLTR